MNKYNIHWNIQSEDNIKYAIQNQFIQKYFTALLSNILHSDAAWTTTDVNTIRSSILSASYSKLIRPSEVTEVKAGLSILTINTLVMCSNEFYIFQDVYERCRARINFVRLFHSTSTNMANCIRFIVLHN